MIVHSRDLLPGAVFLVGAWVACGGAGGDGAGSDLAVVAGADVAAEFEEDAGLLDCDGLVHVGRDVRRDPGSLEDTWRDVPRDVPRDIRDLPVDSREVIRDLPYVHRDAGGDIPTRDTHKG